MIYLRTELAGGVAAAYRIFSLSDHLLVVYRAAARRCQSVTTSQRAPKASAMKLLLRLKRHPAAVAERSCSIDFLRDSVVEKPS